MNSQGLDDVVNGHPGDQAANLAEGLVEIEHTLAGAWNWGAHRLRVTASPRADSSRGGPEMRHFRLTPRIPLHFLCSGPPCLNNPRRHLPCKNSSLESGLQYV